jgi:hypothetical protein
MHVELQMDLALLQRAMKAETEAALLRAALDDTWRQVVRYAGGNPDELLGPAHDTLLARG